MNPIQQFQQDLINKYYGLIPAWEITNLYTPSDHEIVFSVKTARYEGKIIASYDNGTLITLSFPAIDFVIYGVKDAQHLTDAIQDFVERGGVFVIGP